MTIQITWDNFKVYNQDSRGIRFKFEDLCRQLFINEYISANQEYRYPHSNPNNPGLEVEPIYDEKNSRWISFQAKYFESQTDYKQIQKSAEQIVEYYSDKVEHVFLFSNKSIDRNSKSFKRILDILSASNITLELITDAIVLDLVRKHSYLGFYYFGDHRLSQEWFKEHNESTFSVLGVRYNRKFNVNTKVSEQLSLFLLDQDAVKYINSKKTNLLEKIHYLYINHHEYRTYLTELKIFVQKLKDIDEKNILDAISWKEKIETSTVEYRIKISNERQKLQTRLEQQIKADVESRNNSNEKRPFLEQSCNLTQAIQYLDTLLKLSFTLGISDEEKDLLMGNVLLIYGEAGTGKSQLLANKTSNLMLAHRKAILLLGGSFLANDSIRLQIMNGLSLSYSLDELVNILEVIGEATGNVIPIFIDALNETGTRILWKNELPSIIKKIRKSPMVKLILTYRPEYEKDLLPDSIIDLQEGGILKLQHRGFIDNTVSSVIQFLNYYGIPFTPSNFLGYELANPLFLTIFCKTYNGEEIDFPQIYERLIENVSTTILKGLATNPNYKDYSGNIIEPLIDELSNLLIEKNFRYISCDDFYNLKYWNHYRFPPAIFKNFLIQEQFFHSSVFEGKEYLYFAYDQMNDYYCAKAIFKNCHTKKEIRDYLYEKVLGIKDEILQYPGNIDVFVNGCALYADTYREECIDIIDSLMDEDKQLIFSRYVSSFQWRKCESIPAETFLDLLQKYPCDLDIIWEMLISNSLKLSHPMNANYLHNLLFKFEINKRDYLWTSYINNLTYEDSNRIIQLINMYNEGDKLAITDKKQIELLLTLFGWLLTSSNRRLRDCTSKAMIEILKEYFSLCKGLLQKFEYVNDPYVIQRLYGIVFGACCKRKRTACDTFQDLALYVYGAIFNKEKVYPDILLRDYARLIIEKYLSEFPKFYENKNFDYKKIVPPYKSEPIADIEPIDYSNIKYGSGLFKIIESMTFEGNNIGVGLYGDFGRYVFQSALRYFKNIDYKKIFDYAIHYILNELGYLENWFGNIDKNLVGYDRHQTLKIERIGKKYQWITMYNILARVSDRYKLSNNYGLQDKEDNDITYEGTWEPYVRDFDPTLNINSMYCTVAPRFKCLDDFVKETQSENMITNISNVEQQNKWLKSKGVYFERLKDILILTDDDETTWISLTKYCDTRSDLETDQLSIRSWLYAYFVTQKQEDILMNYFHKGCSIVNYEITSHHETYTIYNREYPWAPSCKTFEKYAWVETKINTDEFEIITEQLPEFLCQFINESNEPSISKLDDNIDHPMEIKCKTIQRKKYIEKEVGSILHATTNLIWEEEYDASKESVISYNVPCAKIIKDLHLHQKEEDSFYYDEKGKLAAFDTKVTKNMNGVVIRKDLLERFLNENNLRLIWFIQMQKETYNQNGLGSKSSNWEGIFSYTTDGIKGEIREI